MNLPWRFKSRKNSQDDLYLSSTYLCLLKEKGAKYESEGRVGTTYKCKARKNVGVMEEDIGEQCI